ncbi:MAG: Rieske 2Fe-2S domain-containing protein [Betaproteobacteria bacterium]|nr:MAG: Rieske 2Fe-2S domain-containing protein [Betaproteobacteria bacterium]
MERSTEIELLQELITLQEKGSAFLDETVTSNPVGNYYDPRRFEAECDQILRKDPRPIAHSSELAQPGSFLRRDIAGLPALLTRDSDGVAHAFLNICRHRGNQLVQETSGRKHRFSCPYHAWTFSNRGELVGVPHEEQGFPEMDRKCMGLKRLGCVERYGWIWVSPSGEDAPDVDGLLAGLAPDFEWFAAADLRVQHSDEAIREANWKILIEGALESYHFIVAHTRTVAKLFNDNLSTYQRFGPHLRSAISRKSLSELKDMPSDRWHLRDHAAILYTIFPATQIVAVQDHIETIQYEPLSPTSTRVRFSILAPKDRLESEEDLAHWANNQEMTWTTLDEDFSLGESIQVGLKSGANEVLTFGRFEGALAAFNQNVNSRL